MPKTEVQQPEQVRPTVFVMQGLPGSGKSTWARNKARKSGRTLIVCWDDLRTMLWGKEYVFDPQVEPAVTKASLAALDGCLGTGLDIIMDEVNLTRRHRREILDVVAGRARTVCVVMEAGDPLENRMKDGRGYDRAHWAKVIEGMRGACEETFSDEGFDAVIRLHSPTEALDI